MTAVVPGRRADPVVKAPRPPQWSQHWANWFLNEVEPLFHSAMETSADYRRKWTRDSPLRFALTYLEDPHLRLQDSDPPLITFNEMHLSLCVAAKRWMEPKRWREGWVAPRGVGKALALDTPVLTVDRGWTTHGDLRVGDRVFDERGVPCNVVRVSERWTDRPCYRLTFSDGEQIVADERHEWWVNDRYSALGERTVETERIAEKWLLTEARGRREVRYSVPVAGPLQYPPADLPIAPYVLGAWLGDGTTTAGAITAGAQDVEQLIEQLRAEGENPVAHARETAFCVNLAKPRPHLCPREHELELVQVGEGVDQIGRRRKDRYRPCRTCVAAFQWHSYRPETAIGPRTNRPLIARLRDLGVLGDKHVPEQYQAGSVEQRLALLQGLMDTDGSVTTRGNCEFSASNERLARDVLRLVLSLGIKAKLRERRAMLRGVDHGPTWRVSFFTTLPVFRLPRKLARIATRVRAAGNRRIVDVERVENQSTSCIEVDSPSHLYLVGRALIPTHNSSWCFLALPLWALAHGHRSYFMAFSADAGMAQNQLANLRQELDPKNGNAKLLGDYPELALRKGFGGSNTKATVVANGGTIAAAGLGQNTLGRKSGANRPDLIILDDIEPLDETMSDREKRSIILDITAGVIPMASPQAAIGIFGTTTSYGSVIHDLAQHARGRERVDWVENNEITPRLFPGIKIDPDTGEERSLWPERWPLTETHLGEWLRRTVDGRIPDEFMRNFLLDPTLYGDEAGSFWRPELITHRDYRKVPGIVEHALYLDVAVTASRSADQTAAVIVGRHPGRMHATVEYAEAWNITPEEIHRRVKRLVERYPTVRTVIVENNQGGDLWLDVVSPRYDPLPRHVRLETEHVRSSKRDRVADALRHYERGAVFHACEFVELERQMVMFPSTKSRDDLVDALTGGLRWAFDDPNNRRVR